MTRQVLFAIQYISIAGLIMESWFVFRKWRSEIHSYILLSSVSTLINNVGYLMQMRATSREAYLAALQMAYLGKVWIPFSLFLFLMLLCGKKVSGAARAALSAVHAVTFALMLTVEYNELYYRNVRFVQTGIFPQLAHGNGVWHYAYDALLAYYIIYGLLQMFIAWRKEKNPLSKKRLFMVILAVLSYSGFFVLYKLTPAWTYDVTSLGYTIGTVFMYIAIFRYDLLDTVTLARDYAIDEVSSGIIAVDSRGEIGYYNKPALALFPSLETDAQGVVNTLRASIERCIPLHIKDRVYTPKANALSRGGADSGTVYVVADDTEHFRYVEKLEEQTRRADSASRAKTVFLANMSHEIRTPINVILGMDELILRESAEKETLTYAENINSAGRTLLSIINDILDLSKIEEGKLEIRPTQYDLNSLAGDLVNMTRVRAEEKGLRLEVIVDEDIPHALYGDELRIRQCAMNVLTNAVKYTERGTITLRIDYEKRNEDMIALRFFVRDTGIGMKPEDVERLFTPFARFEESRNRSIEGTGLGMSITKQLLALMDSKLEVESVYGEGSTFSFSVDQQVLAWEPIGAFAAEDADAAVTRKAYHALFCAPDARILVVDDMPVNLAVITGLLKRTRIQVDTAESGAAALRMARQQRYDAMFIDHMMPEMDGIETLHKLRALPGVKDTPCVALTANAISGAREMYLAEGFTDYLSKPVDGGKLEELLCRCLPPEKLLEPGDEAEAAEAALPEWLYDVDGLNVEEGLAHCGSAEAYLETLTIYAQSAGDIANELRRHIAEMDIKSITIKVHALKSTSRAVGVLALGNFAERMEIAGKAGDTRALFLHLGDLIEQVDAIGAALAPLCGGEREKDAEALPVISDERLREIFASVRKYALDFDDEGAAAALRELDGFAIPEAEREHVEAIRRMVSNFDWDRIDELL